MNSYEAKSPKILIVDDERNIVDLLATSLKFQGFEVKTAFSGTTAMSVVRTFKPDAMILDVMMPGMDGFTLLKRLRGDGLNAPALFLTAKDSLEDKLHGLTIGADDYVTKPFSLEEIIVRLRVILRRVGIGKEEKNETKITFQDIVLDDESHEVWKDGNLIQLSPTEFTLLRYFMVNSGVVLSKSKILDHVWNYEFGGEVNVVESYVSYLRKKVDNCEPRLIHTLRGVGYVMRAPK